MARHGSSAAYGPYGEQDDAYREDDDPAEESEPSGIGGHDGILEQVGWCDNQFTVMA